MKLRLLLPLVIAITLVAAVACEEEEAEPTPAPQPTTAVVQPTPVPEPTAVPPTPTPSAPPATREDPKAFIPAGTELHPEQYLHTHQTVYEGGGRPIWQDGGRIMSQGYGPWVYGTLVQIGEDGNPQPYIAASWSQSEDGKAYTVKIRDDVVYQDGTPFTAADVKAFWEHGAKPENIASWGGASRTIGTIEGWDDLRAGDTSEATGLVVIDDRTLEIRYPFPNAGAPLEWGVWNAGFMKLEQAISDTNAFNHPIGVGPYRLTISVDAMTFEAVADAIWWGPKPNIEKIIGLGIQDEQVALIALENGEVDYYLTGGKTKEEALKPGTMFYGLTYESQGNGSVYWKFRTDQKPLDDLLIRKALVHGTDNESILRAVYGAPEIIDYPKGLVGAGLPCHDPDKKGYAYDPDLARQSLAESPYAGKVPVLRIDNHVPQHLNASVAVKEYWKDNLNVELDILKREQGMERREDSQLRRTAGGSMHGDPAGVIRALVDTSSTGGLTPIEGGYPVLQALLDHMNSLPLGPELCDAMSAVEDEFLANYYIMPQTWTSKQIWIIQPWVKGFEAGTPFNILSMPWMYITKH